MTNVISRSKSQAYLATSWTPVKNLTRLPSKFLLHAFSYLSGQDLIKIGYVNKKFNIISNNDLLWHYITIREVPYHYRDPTLSDKSIYLRHQDYGLVKVEIPTKLQSKLPPVLIVDMHKYFQKLGSQFGRERVFIEDIRIALREQYPLKEELFNTQAWSCGYIHHFIHRQEILMWSESSFTHRHFSTLKMPKIWFNIPG
jgi:hypothetical protein